MSDPQLLMRRADLLGLPPLMVPSGYQLRRATAGDGAGLAALLSAAFGDRWDDQRVAATLLQAAEVKATFVITSSADGSIVATASAALRPEQFPGAGYVHWVATHPGHGGKGLGGVVSLAVLHEMAALGLRSSVLETDDARRPAIAVYRKLGFVPELTHPSHAPRWQAILGALPS